MGVVDVLAGHIRVTSARLESIEWYRTLSIESVWCASGALGDILFVTCKICSLHDAVHLALNKRLPSAANRPSSYPHIMRLGHLEGQGSSGPVCPCR